MSASHFVWYELVTHDIDAATSFYGTVLGWTATDFPGGADRYAVVSAQGKGVGGVMMLPPGMTEPFWMGYVGTPGIAVAVAKWKHAGGTVHREFEIPTVGRIALVSDPQGAGFAMIQGASEHPSEAFKPGTRGHGGWHELHTSNWQAAWDFYAGQFGWTKDTAVEMAMGTYQVFAADGVQIGGMMNDPQVPRPAWLYYFCVEDIDAAAERVTGHRGQVLMGPHEVPGGDWIVVAKDPQGAAFALVGSRR